jgi:hypothetical protein
MGGLVKCPEETSSAKDKKIGYRAMLSILSVTGVIVMISMIPSRDGTVSSPVKETLP